VELLRARIRQQQAKQDAVKAAQQVKQEQKQQQEEILSRKQRLNNAFGGAFASAKAKQAEEAAAARAAAKQDAAGAAAGAQAEADAIEVQRVLSSKSDYDVLQLKPGCGAAALKKRYKEMAVRLHPDKCKDPQASSAFQRAHRAYQALQSVVL
jgi:hypothetical protein